MHTKFAISMDSIPQSSGCFCLSLKFGSIVAGLVAILYSVLGLAECTYAISQISSMLQSSHYGELLMFAVIIVVTISNAVTFILSTALLIGVLKEKPRIVRPWVVWISALTIIYMLVFVFSSTMNLVTHYSDGSLVFYMIDFLVLVVRVYMLIIVSSYYRQLIAERKDESYKIIQNNWSYTV